MSYQYERDQFITRMTREGLSLDATLKLLRYATTINRLAELACSSEAADRDRIMCPRHKAEKIAARSGITPSVQAFDKHPCLCDYSDGQHTDIPRIRLQDYRMEQLAIKAVPPDWRVITEGDPRGYTLRVIPPSYAERNKGRDRHNLDAIGVPARESRIRW